MYSELLHSAREVREVNDPTEAAKLLQSGEWVAINAAFQGDKIVWCLIRPGRRDRS